jgi:5-formyltetrahydrofolate cyclo-ligase
MSKTQLRKLTWKKEVQFKKREARREMGKVAVEEAKLLAQKEAEELAEFQRLAAGGGPEANKPS